jgi:polysaccharide biosynthesis/export protein
VAKPGEQTFWPNMSVRQALALAGGAVPPQARFPKPSRDLSALKTDYGLALVELAQATAKIARVTAELKGESDLVGVDFSNLPLPREELVEIQESEKEILRARVANYRRELDFLKAAVDQSDERISVIQKQQEEEEQGSRADTVELRRLVDLLSKGQETNPRITDARRALLLSSTRALQVNAELLELKRQKAESARAVQRIEDERRVSLLMELQDAASAKTVSRIKIEALEADFGPLPHAPGLFGTEEEMQQSVEVVRQGRGVSTKSIVGDDFVLMPGDVIKVSFRAPEKSAQNDR